MTYVGSSHNDITAESNVCSENKEYDARNDKS